MTVLNPPSLAFRMMSRMEQSVPINSRTSFARAEKTVNRGTPDGANPIASGAAAFFINDMSGPARDFKFGKQLQLMRFDLPLGLAGGAKDPDQPLGNDEPDERL